MTLSQPRDRQQRESVGARSVERHFTARTPRTKERYRKQDADLRAEISALLQQDGFPSETTEKIAGWDPYDQNAAADFFDPEWMFGITDGFDVVIGNSALCPSTRKSRISKDHVEKTLSLLHGCRGPLRLFL